MAGAVVVVVVVGLEEGGKAAQKKLQVVAEARALPAYTRCEAHAASRRGRCEVSAVATS